MRLPEINLKSVDFPQPLGPSRQVHTPPNILKLNEEKRGRPENPNVTSVKVISGADVLGVVFAKIVCLFPEPVEMVHRPVAFTNAVSGTRTDRPGNVGFCL